MVKMLKLVYYTPVHHEVGKTIVVDSGNVAPSHSGVDTLLANIYRQQALEPSMVIPYQAMHPQQPNHAVVPQHLQHIAPTLLVLIPVHHRELLKPLLLPLQDLSDHRILHQCLQVIKNPIHTPCL